MNIFIFYSCVCRGASSLAFAYHYIGESKIKKMIHSTNKSTFDEQINILWNAAIDLTLPALVSKEVKIAENKIIPIFVTGDERLWLLFNTLKMKMLFTNHGEPNFPPFIELNLVQTNWKQKEIELLRHYSASKNGIYKMINRIVNETDKFDFINKMRRLNYDLEMEVKTLF